MGDAAAAVPIETEGEEAAEAAAEVPASQSGALPPMGVAAMVADGDRHGRRVLVRLPCSLQQKRPIRVACDDEMDEVVVGVASMTVGSKRQRTEGSEGEVGRCDDEGRGG